MPPQHTHKGRSFPSHSLACKKILSSVASIVSCLPQQILYPRASPSACRGAGPLCKVPANRRWLRAFSEECERAGGGRGGTRFLQTRGGRQHRFAEVTPRPGLVLLFEHPMLHEGAALVQGLKYCVRTDGIYEKPDAPAHPQERPRCESCDDANDSVAAGVGRLSIERANKIVSWDEQHSQN